MLDDFITLGGPSKHHQAEALPHHAVGIVQKLGPDGRKVGSSYWKEHTPGNAAEVQREEWGQRLGRRAGQQQSLPPLEILVAGQGLGYTV